MVGEHSAAHLRHWKTRIGSTPNYNNGAGKSYPRITLCKRRRRHMESSLQRRIRRLEALIAKQGSRNGYSYHEPIYGKERQRREPVRAKSQIVVLGNLEGRI